MIANPAVQWHASFWTAPFSLEQHCTRRNCNGALLTPCSSQAAAGNEDDVKEPLTALDRAVACIILERTIERNLVLVAGAKARLEKQQQQQSQQAASKQAGQAGAGEGRAGSKRKGAGQPGQQEEEKERERAARPEDLVRLFDTLLQV